MLDRAQKRQLTAARKLLKTDDRAQVLQGLQLLVAAADPALWSVLATGLWVDDHGTIQLTPGEITRRVKKDHQGIVAVYAAVCGRGAAGDAEAHRDG